MFDYSNDYIITKPTRDEQIAARIDTSDFMISGLTIQSDILFTFGFCSKVYRSKVTTVQKSTKRKVSKYMQMFNKLLSMHSPEAPVSEVFADKDLTVTSLSDQFHIDFSAIFGCGATSWDNLAKMEVLLPIIAQETRSKYAKPPRFKYNFEDDDIEEIIDEYEPSEVEVEECKHLYVTLQKWIAEQKKLCVPYRKFAQRCAVMESVMLILNEPTFIDIKDDVINFNGTVDNLRKFIDNFLTPKACNAIHGHSQTVMENECIAKQEEVAEILSREGIDFDFNGFKYYLENYAPEVIDKLVEKYALDIYSLDSFEEMRNYFYEPRRMHAIREALGVKVRSRSLGGERKGGKWMLKSYNFDKRIKRLQDSIADFNETDSSQRIQDLKEKLEQRSKENSEAKKARKHARQRYELAKRSKDAERIENARKEYDEIIAAADSISKTLSATKTSYNKALAEHKKKKNAVAKIEEYRKKYMEVIDKVKNAVGKDTSAVEQMETSFQNNVANDDVIPYSTWSFRAYGINEDVIRMVTTELENAFSTIKDSNDARFINYINVSSHAFIDKDKNAITEFFVDYPKDSKLYKALDKNKKLSKAMLETISNSIFAKLKYHVDFDYKNVVVNVDMGSTLLDVPN